MLAAIYLQEIAPKNKWTQAIEVNINNLAAVPSIVFGLLGLAVFINFFHLPRSAPLVGGLVLALMTLPRIIIPTRAAFASIPPSIREAALGVGASRIQAVFHHVLPLAMPGILTGTIIGLAQAAGETAPLLMIGMMAFIVDTPTDITAKATVLPAQIYMWAAIRSAPLWRAPRPALWCSSLCCCWSMRQRFISANALKNGGEHERNEQRNSAGPGQDRSRQRHRALRRGAGAARH